MSNREDDLAEDEWSKKKRLGMTLALTLFIPSYLMGMYLVKVGGEGLSSIGSALEPLGVIAAGISLLAVAMVCVFSFIHRRPPRLTDVKPNGE